MKKLSSIFKSRVFFRYILSYLGVLVLALVLTGLFLYTYFLSQYQAQVVTNLELQLEQTKIVLDDQIQKIDAMSKQIFANPDMKLVDLAVETPQAMKVQTELKKYALSELLLYDIYYYPGQNEWLISPSTSIAIDRFVTRYPIKTLTNEDFLTTLTAQWPNTVYPAEYLDYSAEKGATSLISFMFSDTNYTTQSNRKLIFFLNETGLRNMLPTESGVLGDILIYDSNGQVISSTLPHEDASRLLSQISADDSVSPQLVTVGDTQYLCMLRRSSKTQWAYLSLVSPQVAFASIYQLKLIIILCFAGILLVGCWLCWVCATRSYAPLNKLNQFAEDASMDGIHKKGLRNEFDSVRDALSALRNSNITLTHEVERSSDAVREQLLYRLIKGEIATTAEFNQQGKFVKLQLPWANYAVAVFYAAYSAETQISELSRYGHGTEGVYLAKF